MSKSKSKKHKKLRPHKVSKGQRRSIAKPHGKPPAAFGSNR